MGVKETLRWARNEWGIFSRQRDMSWRDNVDWMRQWVPFGARTIGYGTLSLMFGPLTRDHRASLWAMKAWSRASMTGLDITAAVEGDHLVPAGGLMYASNHQSLLDILVLGAVLPGDLKWATKRSIMKVPFLGWHLQLSGHVPVDRKAGSRAAAQTIKRFERVLSAGKQLLVFPEGTRSPDGSVKPFKNGGFYAAVRANVPVVPVALEGTHSLMGKHATQTKGAHRHVDVCIGAPIHPPREGKERERVEALRDSTYEAVVAMHQQLCKAR